MTHPVTESDPYVLERFVEAQKANYADAIAEIGNGRKRSHWMWYVFPQFAGLGSSPTSRRFAIQSIGEARAFLAHPVLGPRLRECAEAAVAVKGRSARDVFGSPDDRKLQSCATLFARVSPGDTVFQRILDRFYDGTADRATLRLLGVGG